MQAQYYIVTCAYSQCVYAAFNYPECSMQAQYYIVTCAYSQCVSAAFNYPACSMQAQYYIVTCGLRNPNIYFHLSHKR